MNGVATDTTLSHDEEILIRLVGEKKGKVALVERRGARHFDLSIEGINTTVWNEKPMQIPYSGWLPLAAIGTLLNFQDLKKAYAMSDHPEMAGDWSAIRDSSDETIWRIFYALVLKREQPA